MDGIASLIETISARLGGLDDLQRALPRAAKDSQVTALIREAVQSLPTDHTILCTDARQVPMPTDGVHLALTSPPYWTLKRYRDASGQLGHVEDYDEFLDGLDHVWRRVYEALVPGGRLVCVVGDVCLSRRQHGRHQVVPLHASIQERCRALGFDNLAPIFWHKISNARHEVERAGGGFLGKPYEPNAVIKNDVEYILMLRKPGGYRAPSLKARILSLIPEREHRQWFNQVWMGPAGASTKNHPAPFPLDLAERLVRMFSFVGDTVLDPFTGTGTTNVAAARWGRNSIGVEVDIEYTRAALARIRREAPYARLSAELHEPHSESLAAVEMDIDSLPKLVESETRGVSAA